MRATNAKAMRLNESAPRAVSLLSLFLGITLLLAVLSGCGPPSPQGDGKPGGSDPSAANSLLELTDETIHERINETRVREVPEENGTADAIVWNFDDDEPKEIRVVDKRIQGTRATLILDITTGSAPGVRNPRHVAGQMRTEWELKSGWALRRWEIVSTENISMKYKNLPKPPAQNSIN